MAFIYMPQPLGAGGIMFSGCPSVRSLKYPHLTFSWVRSSTRPTVTVLRHVRPSASPSVRRGFREFARRTLGGNGLKKFWHYFDLLKRLKFGVSGHFLENAWRLWPEIWYADISWSPLSLIRLWLRYGDFLPFCLSLVFAQSSQRPVSFLS